MNSVSTTVLDDFDSFNILDYCLLLPWLDDLSIWSEPPDPPERLPEYYNLTVLRSFLSILSYRTLLLTSKMFTFKL